MAVQILMPALSPTMEEGGLAKWLVKEGDRVKSGDVIAEIETDKATMEFEAVDEGIIGKILVPAGSPGIKVNAPIAILIDEGESIPDELLASIPAPTSAPAGSAKPEAAPAAAQPAVAAPIRAEGTRIFASPLARRIAAQANIDLAGVTGSGPYGRIVKTDIEAAIAAPKPVAAPAAGAAPAGMSTEAVLRIFEDREYVEVPLDGMRRTVAARLTEAKQTIPHFYLRREVNLDPLLAFRKDLNQKLESRGVKFSINDFIIKACAAALQAVPDTNAVWAGDRILRIVPSDVAVAVAIDGGLFTPVIRDADRKSLSSLSAEMKDLAERARTKKLAPHEYVGGSFAISNLGMFGIESFDAVINPPHGSILAVGAGVRKPVVNADGSIGVGTMMNLTLSVDHRVIDGALGAAFLKQIIESLEDPISLLV